MVSVICFVPLFEVDIARCQHSSSKPCLLFGPCEPRSLQEKWLRKNYNFGTAASFHGLKVVLSKEFAEHENEAVKFEVGTSFLTAIQICVV